MRMPVLYYETNSTDPCYNLAFEEYLLKNKGEGNILMLWQNANTVVVGLNQNTAEEINPAFTEEHGITVVRRTTGGGAVYHDLGNLNYSFITDLGDAASMSIRQFSQPVCAALASMGVKAEVGGRNDILIEGKKVSGVAQRIYKNRILHHGTLLFASDPAMISGALNVDPSKFASKSTKSVRSRVGNIKDYLPGDMSLQDFWSRLLEELAKDGAVKCTLTAQELDLITAEAEGKYRSWDWTYGKSPAYTMKKRARYPGGQLEVRLLVDKGLIRQAAFSGDYMAVSDSAPAVNAISGVMLCREDVAAALSGVDIPAIFGGISLEEILETIFS